MTFAESKPSIPSVNNGTTQNTVEAMRFLDAVKANLDIITGRARGVSEIQTLGTNASLPDVIAKINELIVRINGSGG